MITLYIGRQRSTHASLEEAVAHHNARRDESGKGASTWPRCYVLTEDNTLYEVSYNGRTWFGQWPDCIEVDAHTSSRSF